MCQCNNYPNYTCPDGIQYQTALESDVFRIIPIGYDVDFIGFRTGLRGEKDERFLYNHF